MRLIPQELIARAVGATGRNSFQCKEGFPKSWVPIQEEVISGPRKLLSLKRAKTRHLPNGQKRSFPFGEEGAW